MACEYCGRLWTHAQGCPNAEQKTIGGCAECGAEIIEGNDLYKDIDDNIFCSEECAEKFWGIHEVEYESVYMD